MRSGDATVPPNFLIFWTEQVRPAHLTGYGAAPSGQQTPNLDRLAREGIRFTRWYAEPRTAEIRSAGAARSPVCTTDDLGGAPAPQLRYLAPALATLLRPNGYATGRFGGCYLDCQEDLLPALHGFDEFFGSLSIRESAETAELATLRDREEPDLRSGLLHCWPDGNGGRRIDAGGTLVEARRAGVKGEALDAAIDFVVRQNVARRPFLVWYSATGPATAADLDDDRLLGGLLEQLDRLDLAGNTLVMYSSPGRTRGVSASAPPDPSGPLRVPCLMRWPGRIPGGLVADDVCSHADVVPTLLAAAGISSIRKRASKVGPSGVQPRLGGYNLLPLMTVAGERAPRGTSVPPAAAGASERDGWPSDAGVRLRANGDYAAGP